MEQKADAPQAPAKSRKSLLIIVAVLVLAGAGGGGWYFLHAQKEKGTADAAKQAPPQYFPLNPAFVVNLADENDRHYLQVDVELMSRDPAAGDIVNRNAPLIRNRLLMLFSQKQSAELRTRADKEKLQSEALEETRKVLLAETGQPGVDALYFTSFVTQ